MIPYFLEITIEIIKNEFDLTPFEILSIIEKMNRFSQDVIFNKIITELLCQSSRINRTLF